MTSASGPPPPPPPPPRPVGAMPPPMPPPRGHRPVLDLAAAFRFGWETFRAQPGPLVGVVVVSYTIIIAVGLAALVLAVGLTELASVPLPLVVLVAIVGIVVFSMVAQFPTIWMLRAGSEAVEGRRITVGRVVRPTGLGAALGAIGLVMAGVLVGYLLLIVPGIVFGVMAAFTLHHVIDAGLAPTDAIRASISLFRRHPGPALGLFFVTTLAASVGVYACGIGIVVSLPVSLLAQVHGFRQLEGRPVPAA